MENENQTDLEEVIQDVENETPQETTEELVVEDNTPEIDLDKFDSKDDPGVVKIDLSNPSTNEAKENNPDNPRVVTIDESPKPPQEQEKVQPQEEVQAELSGVEEITEQDTVTEEEVFEALDANEETGKAIPENVQKLIDFMDDTGGDLSDYVNLNRNVAELDSQDALHEYYKKTKPHLDSEEINFLMEDNFSFDEDIDEERDIKRKKLALKEQVAEAKTYLDGQKSKYYEEIKAGSKLTEEQQKAINFFNRYNKESEQERKVADKQKSVFNKKTEQVFNDKFKGFDYSVGDKKYRVNVNNADQIKDTQKDINNFFKKFLNKDDTMRDAEGYHKGLFTAMNADAVAQHFYEQGKVDAIKDSVAKAKNINTDTRGSYNESQDNSGYRVKVLGDDSESFKFKIKNNKNKN
mgnify:FL=1